MKLCTFEVITVFGSMERIGVETPGGKILDINLAYTLMLAEQERHPRARELANVIVPPDMLAWLENGSHSRQATNKALAYLGERVDDLNLSGPKGERLVYARQDVRLLAPVPRPPMIRDSGGFLQHSRELAKKLPQIRNMVEILEENPLYVKLNPTTVRGTDTDVLWPPYTDVLDYELEIAAVIGRKGKNIPREEAWGYIAGYTIFNDVSARDYQMIEMAAGMVGQGKDWDGSNLYGPFITTADEFDPNKDHLMIARVNGEEWSRGLTSTMDHKFDEIVSYASQSQTLYPGELIGSATVLNGCGLELSRFIRPGDVVELEVEGIGILRSRFVRPEGKRVRWAATARLRPKDLSTAPSRRMELVKVAPDVYACEQEDRGTPGFSNSMFVTRGGGLVVDTLINLDCTQRMIDLYKEVGPWPPRYLVNTHADADHVWGNQLFPDSEIIGHRLCAKRMAEAKYMPQQIILMLTNPNSPPGMREFFTGTKEVDLFGIVVTPPTRLIEDHLDLELDGYLCKIIYVGPAHRPDDLIVYLPKQKVLAAGDLVFNGLTPNTFGGTYEALMKAYDLMESLDPKVVVVGHGPLGGVKEVKENRSYFEFVHAEAKRLYHQGLSPLEASKKINLGDFAKWGISEILCWNVHTFYREFRGGTGDEKSGELSEMGKVIEDCYMLKTFWSKG